jgi:hypothetical protein
MNMLKTAHVVGAIAAVVLTSAPAAAQDAKRSPSYTVTLNQDTFFGFNPSFNGLLPVSDTVDFSFYGTFWTRPSFGLGQGNSGGDLWTEFGLGANFNLVDGKLRIKPQIGFTNGSLLSGGVENEDGEITGALFADGIVPSLTVNYSDQHWESEFYLGYYAALRQRNGDAALDFLHTWVNAGYKFSSLVSGGLHYEILSNTRNTYPDGETAIVYQWLGPYIQFSLPKGFFARFTAGPDLEGTASGDFYKMSVGMSF